MSDELRPGDLFLYRSAVLQGVDGRSIELLAVPYEQETIVGDGPGPIRELVERSAFTGLTTERTITANREHDRTRTFGKVVEVNTEDPRGLITVVRASETALGDETLALAKDNVLAPSVGMIVRRLDQVIERAIAPETLNLRRVHRAFLQHLALVPDPAYAGAQVLAVRSGSQQNPEPTEPPSTPNMDAVVARMRELIPGWTTTSKI